MNRRETARQALLAVRQSPYPTDVGGIVWRLALLWPRGTPIVARGEPVDTSYRVVHRARLAIVGERFEDDAALAVRTYCGAIILDPRTPDEVEDLTDPNAVLDCVRCLRRTTPRRRRPADSGLLVDPATGIVLDDPLPGLER